MSQESPHLTPLADGEARTRIRRDLDATLVVEAAAGTGKTTELVSRIISLVGSGRARLSTIVSVTFTEKAAGELKLRLRTEIEKARASAPVGSNERRRLDDSLPELEVARIGTIHSLCADLLREHPVEARIDPTFEIAAGDDEARLYGIAFEAWFQRTLADPPEGVRRILRRKSDAGPRADLKKAGEALRQLRGFDAPWRRDPFDRNAAIDLAISALTDVATLAPLGNPRDPLTQHLGCIKEFVDELSRREAISGRDHDNLEWELSDFRSTSGYRHKFWTLQGWTRGNYATGITRDRVWTQRAAAKETLDALAAACEADLAPCLRDNLLPLLATYEALKARAGRLDFIDLLEKARNLVRDSAAVRAELQRQFTHILVDEFQDTDPLQAEILVLLSADVATVSDWKLARPLPGKLFVVGDPKQSIYRFRRADVALYESIKDRLISAGAELVHLSTSFRGVPAIHQAVNAAFGRVMQPNAQRSQAEYVALEHHREALADQPAVIALPVPRPYGGWGNVTKGAIKQSLPVAIAAFVDYLVHQSGWRVTERTGATPVKLEAKHVCILFRQFEDWGDATRPLIRALETRRLPHVLVGGRSYQDREEVMAIRNALVAIEWPDDELAVYATLRGPLFGLSDGALLDWRHTHRRLQILRHVDASTLSPGLREIANALEVLAGLHATRNRHPVADTITRLLDATRAHVGIAIWPTGEQALANVLRVVDLARRFEVAGATSFRAFVESLDEDADRSETTEAPTFEEGTDGVRIMTVHKAKGLEFPVVILADPTINHTHENPARHVDPDRGLCVVPLAGCVPADLADNATEALKRDHEESLRVAYVAATRARDLLVVPTIGDSPLLFWLDVLNPALYPEPDQKRAAVPALGCPRFGTDSVVERDGRATRTENDAVAPGLHTLQPGDREVVWWDPNILDLDREDVAGLRQQLMLAATTAPPPSDVPEASSYTDWNTARSAAIEDGARATLVVRSVAAVAKGTATIEPSVAPDVSNTNGETVRFEQTDCLRHDRPHGKRFGTLVHAVLAEIDFHANAADITRLAAVRGRYLDATAEEIAAATMSVESTLRHPILRRAAAAAALGLCRREAPVAMRLPDGSIADGIIDLTFRDDSGAQPGWTIVDFKTDGDTPGTRRIYEAQVQLYVRAVIESTASSARGILLSV